MKHEKTKRAKWELYAVIVALFALFGVATSALTQVVAYPTQEHRQVYLQMVKLDNEAMEQPDGYKIYESSEYKSLSETSAASYTFWANLISFIASIAAWVVVVVYTYGYLRVRRVNNNPIWTIVGLDVLAIILSAVPIFYFETWYLGESLFESVPAYIAIPSAVFGILVSALLTAGVAKAAELRYNRSHGFIAD